MRRILCAALLAACGGQDLGEKALRNASDDLIVNWAASGNETDPNAALGAQFGSSVATNGNWIAVARQPASAGDIAHVEVWQRSGTGWAHNMSWSVATWSSHAPGHRAVVAMSPGRLLIGEPCISNTPGCVGYFEIFELFHGNLWALRAGDSCDNPASWDCGTAIAVSDTDWAITSGGVVSWYKYEDTSFNFPLQASFTEPASIYLDSGFGSSIAMTNHGVAVAAPNGSPFPIHKGVSQRSPGYVYVFGPGATDVTRLTGVGTQGATGGPGFGGSISTSQDGLTLAVGAGTEVDRFMTAYVFHENAATNTWGKPTVIAHPSGATGSDIRVAIDGGLLGVTTGNGSTGTASFFSFSGGLLGGAQLNASFALDYPRAPVDLRGGRAIVGQPDFLGSAGYIATYAGTQPVIAVNPPVGALNP
jgi:hypothetical protein